MEPKVSIKLPAKDAARVERFAEITGVNVFACYQCGNCSASCPATEFMDVPPHQVMRYLQLEMFDEIVKANTCWICAACITCTAKCPRGIDIAKTMEGLRQIFLEEQEFARYNIFDIKKKVLEKLPQIALVGNFRKNIL
ncbi:MAG: 4Fe-4S dicluster domain-containing protein [Candidatus Marinimicrobia bacterium]|nr:4Fe-4S dicluster domain-containing protein [Candidatus Neomarinimicrobiota bacterium]